MPSSHVRCWSKRRSAAPLDQPGGGADQCHHGADFADRGTRRRASRTIGVRALFERHGGNPMEFITGNEVYDHLEKTVDRFDDVANELQGVVIEHV